MTTDTNPPWGIHTIRDMIGDESVQAEYELGWGRAVPEPFASDPYERIRAAWWVLTGRAQAVIWPETGDLEAAIGGKVRKPSPPESYLPGLKEMATWERVRDDELDREIEQMMERCREADPDAEIVREMCAEENGPLNPPADTPPITPDQITSYGASHHAEDGWWIIYGNTPHGSVDIGIRAASSDAAQLVLDALFNPEIERMADQLADAYRFGQMMRFPDPCCRKAYALALRDGALRLGIHPQYAKAIEAKGGGEG